MARGKAHDPETKAAVLAALLAGQGADDVARTYQLPRATVQEWQRQVRLAAEVVQTQKRPDASRIGDLLVRYLERNLTTLEIQAEQFSDAAWLHRQNAADAAVLHGVLTDKAVRLLEALDPGDGDADAAVP